MAFEYLETEYICAHKAFMDVLNVRTNLWKELDKALKKYRRIRRSFDEIKPPYDTTSEVYIQKTKDFDNANDALKCASTAYDAYDCANFVKIRDISDIAKQEYNRAVKLRIKEMFPVNLAKKLKQIAFERRLHAITVWAAARVPRRKA
uniref:Uncharacterized protein n=1 Tax=viral metagenome TaxID=1070528 RepID=A0A6C0K1H1_9ZZZZ